jgi:hypothetical protein
MGSSAERNTIESGAGRMPTRRSDSARARLASTEETSIWAAILPTSAISFLSPRPARASGSEAICLSTRALASCDRQEVSRAMMLARHSEILPASKAALTCVRSVARNLANERSWLPRKGETRRARPIWCPTPRERRTRGTPCCSALARWPASTTRASRACRASRAHFASSIVRSSSIASAGSAVMGMPEISAALGIRSSISSPPSSRCG